jgi:hypothetical protein
MSNPSTELGNVPAQPQYGEVQDIDAQVAGAPLPQAQAAPEAPGAPSVPPVQPRPTNIVDVLPPIQNAPANTGARPLNASQQLAYLILGSEGMSDITRTFAAQIVGQYRQENNLPAQQLGPDALARYRAAKKLPQQPIVQVTPPTEEG